MNFTFSAPLMRWTVPRRCVCYPGKRVDEYSVAAVRAVAGLAEAGLPPAGEIPTTTRTSTAEH